MLAVVGDFNVDFSRTDRRHTNDLLQFMCTNSLIAKDLDFPDVQFTYESDDGLRRSWGDYVLIFPTCVQRIQEITVISSGMNLSDHRPLCVKLCLYMHSKWASIVTFSAFITQCCMAQSYPYPDTGLSIFG